MEPATRYKGPRDFAKKGTEKQKMMKLSFLVTNIVTVFFLMSDKSSWMWLDAHASSIKGRSRKLAAILGKVLRSSGNLLFQSSLLPCYVQKTCCCDGCSMTTVVLVNVNELI